MALRIYRGSFESDMIEKCFEEIKENRQYKHLVIIPEHYSYEMERMMVDRFEVIAKWSWPNISIFCPGSPAWARA